MPNHKSCLKRMKQNEYRRQLNKRYRTHLKNTIKAFSAIEDPEAAREALPSLMSAVDTANRKGIIHRKKAARIKSRLSEKISR